MVKQFHVFFFPMLAHGHMIPSLDIAKLFTSRGIKTTIITTPQNVTFFTKAVERATQLGQQMSVRAIDFPVARAGLPETCQSLDQVQSEEMLHRFFRATVLLQPQLEQVMAECRPNCLVADMFFPWATESAAKFGIPRLVFHGISYFALVSSESLMLHKPQLKVKSEVEPFVLPELPHEVKMTRMQLANHDKEEMEHSDFAKLLREIKQSEIDSFGVLVNSFYELEPDYADHYRNVIGKRAWQIGPVCLYNRERSDKANRGKESSIDEHECLKWLDSKKPNSVIYVSFGSLAEFTHSQLHEIAMGLESSGHHFIWVVRKSNSNGKELLPEGFDDRIKNRGLIIRGWAPQVLILEHEAVGGFITHCGWNSTLEGICAGLPMVTWPVMAEQFLNEILVTEILKTGVRSGARKCGITTAGEEVKREAVAMAVGKVMEGREAEEMRERARKLKEMAMNAIEEGGSSYNDFNSLLEELINYHPSALKKTTPVSN
ncbi:scopoletin glucosyltransferase-like [Impatiens glandulifera]|uniref:scopoletin glucosyltransferase-like n=1 Tax=Impatiens glandulifera TaxID=253017 RepID=UPI001FB194C7|nr:scopoletin glucosyltransferase-like [Impatiens glandulifera]